jgi:5'-3' exonuclease
LTKTLLVDGNNLFKIGFHGVRDYYHKGNHIGGLYHFVNTLRRFIEEDNYDKVIVVWDGENNSSQRRLIYADYKMNRRQSLNEQKKESYDWQMSRIKQYLEDMFIRQLEVEGCEADDVIAYYCNISEDEHKTIFSSDKDLTQLISEKVTIYSPSEKKYLKQGEKINLKDISIPHENIKTFKIISGDKSDNVDGIQYMGEKTFVKLFPEIVDKVLTVEDILSQAEELHSSDKNNRALQNLLSGKTKSGVYGEEFFLINKKLIDLSDPIISEEGKEEVEDYYRESLDPDGRGYKNLMRMMMDDGIFKYLPKRDDAWVNFLQPFMKLTRKEKKRFKNKK